MTEKKVEYSSTTIAKNEKREKAFQKRIEKCEKEGKGQTGGEQAQAKFWESGGKIPKCVNIGCENLLTIRDWKNVSPKSECGRCQTDRKVGNTRAGITIVRKNYCENIDGHLGYDCPVKVGFFRKKEDVWAHYLDALHLDHKDGNHFNNVPDNVETICAVCHARKSRENDDVNSQKPSGRKLG